MFTKLFINAFSSLFNQNRGVSIVRGGLTPFFRQVIIKNALNWVKWFKMWQNDWYKAAQ